MAGFTVTRETWAEVLQNDYVTGKFWSAVNTATPMMDEFTTKETTHGLQRVAILQTGIAQGNGARGEMEPLPVPGARRWKNPITTCKLNYASIAGSGPGMVFSTAKAFFEFANSMVQGGIEGFQKNLGRQTWGDGQGILALVNGALSAGATTITVDSPYGVLWGSLSTYTTKLIETDQVVQFGTENNNGAGYTVGLVSATTFVISPALVNAVADNATISLLLSANKEVEGWLKMVATAAFQTTLGLSTTYHGIDRALVPQWEGNVLNGNAALSLAMIRTLRDIIWARTNDDKSDLFMTSSEIMRDYEALLVNNVRFVPLELKGGRKVLSHDGLKISRDTMCPTKSFSLADTESVHWVQPEAPNWITDGGDIMRVIPGRDGKEAQYRWYSNLEPKEPRRLGICYNITVS